MISGIVAGCGSGGGGGSNEANESSAPSEPSVVIPWGPRSFGKNEYIKRANRVCQESRTFIPTSYEGRFRNVNSGKLYAEATTGIFLPQIQVWFDDISYLGAPPHDKPQIEDLLTTMQLAIYDSEKQPILSSRELSDRFAEYNRLAHAYRLNRCLVENPPFATS
jgi:hypothetical protein